MKFSLRAFSKIFSTESRPHERRTPSSTPLGHLRYKTYEVLHTVAVESRLELTVKIGLAVLIVLNVLVVILETVPSIEQTWGKPFADFELFTIVVFSIEYLLRLWSIVESPRYAHPVAGRIRYIFSVFALIDLASILPFYLPALIKFDLQFLRGFRLLRLLRILKLGSYSHSLSTLVRVAKNKRSDIGVSLTMILLLIVLSACVFYFLEHDAQPTVVSDIPATIWWGVAKISALKFVNITPVTVAGKVCDAIMSALGIIFIAIPSCIFAAGLIEEFDHRKHKATCPNCGHQMHI